jgi:hypothetical protein
VDQAKDDEDVVRSRTCCFFSNIEKDSECSLLLGTFLEQVGRDVSCKQKELFFSTLKGALALFVCSKVLGGWRWIWGQGMDVGITIFAYL